MQTFELNNTKLFSHHNHEEIVLSALENGVITKNELNQLSRGDSKIINGIRSDLSKCLEISHKIFLHELSMPYYFKQKLTAVIAKMQGVSIVNVTISQLDTDKCTFVAYIDKDDNRDIKHNFQYVLEQHYLTLNEF